MAMMYSPGVVKAGGQGGVWPKLRRVAPPPPPAVHGGDLLQQAEGGVAAAVIDKHQLKVLLANFDHLL